MKKLNIYMLLACLCVVFSCVQVDEGIIDQGSELDKVLTTFTAMIDKDETDTKTVLDGKLGDGTRKVKWQPMDTIGVAQRVGDYPEVEKFAAKIDADTTVAEFEGAIAFATEYHAFYPYQSDLRDSTGIFIFKLPQVQRYVEESFDPNSAPMVAVAKNGETLKFKNLCGILALRLTGNESVKSVTFIGKDADGNNMPVSGVFEATPSADSDPSLVCRKGVSSVTLDCETPVMLSADASVPFYMMLPPATYSSFIVMVTTSDGKVMMKEATKPLTIKRSDVQPTAALAYAETVAIDLSDYGTANSYIISESGLYSFNATVIGNGEFGLIEGAGFHTDRTSIDPVDAELVWEDRPGVITAPAYGGGKISFMAPGKEGNALVAAKDADGKIVWSWHIWVTDQPVEHVYVNDYGTFTVQDRNLGATRNDRGNGDEWAQARGLYYQWGRKDPFAFTWNGIYMNSYLFTTHTASKVSIATSIENPNMFIGCGSSSWEDSGNASMWTKSQKTIYDPCPLGYMVIDPDAWRSFTSDGNNQYSTPDNYRVASAFDKGWNFLYDGVNSAYYPANDYIYRNGNHQGTFTEEGRVWSSVSSSTQDAYRLRYWNNDWESGIEVSGTTDRYTYGQPVRCMKDKMANTILLRLISVSDPTSTSVKAVASFGVQGDLTIERAGFVYGTDASVTLETGTAVDVDGKSGDVTKVIEGLVPLTKYYIKAFAIDNKGKAYYSTKTLSFITSGEDGVIDLSIGGTANCYIVYPVKGSYSFDLVKGNSSESVGEVTSLEVLWETYNTSDAVTAGTVIESASMTDGKPIFNVPENAVPGNAVIAAKNADGTILWSWHIWVIDYDPDLMAQKYPSGAILMDRHLGALTAEPGDPRTNGLLYQWGRKDPLIGYVDSNEDIFAATYPEDVMSYNDSGSVDYQYSIEHPTEAIRGYDTQWCDGLRWDLKKTIYDPCPVGWKVPDGNPGVWAGVGADVYIYYHMGMDLNLVTPKAYYPTSGYVNPDGNGDSETWYGWVWTCSLPNSDDYCDPNTFVVSSFSNGSAQTHNTRNRSHQFSVRCMKIDDSGKPGSGDDYVVDDEYEWE